MSQQIINLGSGPDTQTGDTVYSAFVKVNENFTELYTVFGNDGVSINANVVLANAITTAGTVTATNLFAYDYVITNGNVVGSNFLFPNGVPYAPLTQPDWSNVSASLIPRPNATYNIGSSANVFSNAYIGNTVFINGGALTYNGNLFLNGVQIGGLNAVTYDSESGNLTIESSDGQDFVVDIGVGRSDNPTFANLTTTGFANINSLQVAGNTVINSNATIRANNLPDSGVIVGTYGNATVVPVITVDAKGRVTTLTTTNVSGVSNVQYNNSTSNLTISTGDGTTYSVDLGVGTSDSPVFSGLSVSGNATVNALTVNGAVTIGGNIIPSANAVYNLGSLSNRFKDLFLTGNSLYLNTASITSNATAVTITNEQGGQFVIDGTSIGGASQISNGTSNVKVFANGNVDITAAGKTFNFDTLGNINAPGNVNVVANVVAPFFIGNIIGNVTGNLSAPGANTQILFNDNNAVGASNNFTFNKQSNNLTIGGSVIAANLNAAIIGNTGAVILSDTGTFTTKVTTANLASGPINANGTVTVNSLVSNGAVSGTTGTFTTSTTTSALNTGTLNANSTATVATLTSNGNITLGGNIIDTGALAIQTGSNGNISLEPNGTGVVVFTKDATGTSATFTTKVTTANLATGAINANGTATVNALISNGSISGTTFTGTDATFTTKVTTGNLATGAINANGTATVNALTSNGAVSGTIFTGTDATFTTKVTTSNLATGAINANGAVTVSSLTSNGTIIAATLNAATIGNVGAALVGASVSAATIGNTGTLLTGTLTTAAQPNITSVGSSLTIGTFLFQNNTITSTNGTITIDPANAGSTGNVIIEGNLRVTGNVTYIDSQTISINDKNILLANNTSNISDLNNGGIILGNLNDVGLVTWTYDTTTSSWQSNVGITPAANASLNLGFTNRYWNTAYIDNVIGTSATFTTKVTTANLATGAINANGTATVNELTSNGAVSGTTFTGTDATFTTKVTTANLATGPINANGTVTINSLVSNGAVSGTTGTFTTSTSTSALNTGTLNANSTATVASLTSNANITLGGNIIDTGALAIQTSSNGNISLEPNGTGVVVLTKDLFGTASTFTTKVTTSNLATGAINANGTVTVNALASNGAVSGTTGTFTTSTTTSALNTGTLNANGTATVNALASNGAVSGTTGTFTLSTTTSALNTGTLNANGTATVNALASNGAVSGTTGLFTTSVTTGSVVSGAINSNGNITANGLTVNASATVGTTLTVAGNITATGGNIYSNNRIGFTYSANTTSVVYQVYNSATNSLDTVFG